MSRTNRLIWMWRFTLPLVASICGCAVNSNLITHNEEPASPLPIVGKRLSDSATSANTALPFNGSTDDVPKDRNSPIKKGDTVSYDSSTRRPEPRPAPQRSKHRILFIGDSHIASAFGKTLTNLLENKAHGTSVTTISSCGSSASWWLNSTPTTCGLWKRYSAVETENSSRGETPLLDELIASVKPDTIIVGLGTNLIPENPLERRKHAEILMQIASAKGLKCFWIGPPDTRKFTAQQIKDVYTTLADLANSYSCHLIDSRAYTHYPSTGGDGIHYSGDAGRAILLDWANQVYKDIYPLL